MGFCNAKQHAEFIRQVPLFEQMLVNEGISLTEIAPWTVVKSNDKQRARQCDAIRVE